MRRDARIHTWLSLAVVAGLASSACDGETERPASTSALHEDAPPSIEPDPAEAPQVIAPSEPAPPAHRERRTVAALEGDDDWGSSEPVEARRLVYRVTLRVPRILGENPPTVSSPAAELHVDVSEDRLRARFVGAGWPVEAGSEVRLRGDRLGVYVFDPGGGRPLAPGQMAEWFQGGPPGRNPPRVWVRPPPPQEDVGSGELVCALLTEWSGHPPETLERRCADKGPPSMFRLGPWQAERTADVPVQLPRSALRSDHRDPPPPIADSQSRAFMEPALLARLEPSRRGRSSAPGATESGDPPAEGLRIVNQSEARLVVTASGVPVGWLDEGATGTFVGLRPGQHVIAGMRPLGQLAWRPRGVRVPATVTVR